MINFKKGMRLKMELIDGKELAKKIRANIKTEVEEL